MKIERRKQNKSFITSICPSPGQRECQEQMSKIQRSDEVSSATCDLDLELSSYECNRTSKLDSSWKIVNALNIVNRNFIFRKRKRIVAELCMWKND